MLVGTRGDGLRLTVDGLEVSSLHAVGAIPGAAVLLAGGRNGEGTGRLRSSGDGTRLSWRAPGSATFGAECSCAADGVVLLEDGEDTSKWVRVQVWATYLAPGPTEADVHLADRTNNAIALDFDTANPTAWTPTLSLENTSGHDVQTVVVDATACSRVWFDVPGGLAQTVVVDRIAAGATEALAMVMIELEAPAAAMDVLELIEIAWYGA